MARTLQDHQRRPDDLGRRGPVRLAADEWHSDDTPAELVGFASASPSERALAFLARLSRRFPERVRIEQLGDSVGGRPIVAVNLRPGREPGRRSAGAEPLRALIFGQQHGDEPAGHEAGLLLVRDLALGRLALPGDRLDLWFVPQLNPDGAALGRRRNADGTDLNRVHHTLAAPELRLLYRLYHSIRPHLTIDLHQFNVERHRFLDGALSDYDVMGDGPTSPNVDPALRDRALEGLDAVRDALAREGFAFRRYLRGDPSTPGGGEGLRHSTGHVIDGRNTPALFGSLAFIVEATRYQEPIARLERGVRATYATVAALLGFAAERAEPIRQEVEAARLAHARGDAPLALRTEYRAQPHDSADGYRYVRPETGERGSYPIPRARTAVAVTRERTLPQAYWLRLADGDPRLDELVGLLADHNVTTSRLRAARSAIIERFKISEVVPNPRDGGRCQVEAIGTIGSRTVPAGARIIATDQLGGRLAGLLLEPDSMDGLPATGGWPARTGERHPIERILTFEPDT